MSKNRSSLLWQSYFSKTSELSAKQLESIRFLLDGKQPFSIYFNSSIDDLRRGIDNRRFYLSPANGLIMCIEFDEITIFTVIGTVEESLVSALASDPGRSEFHVSNAHAEFIMRVAGDRICRRAELVYYLLESPGRFNTDGFDLRLLRPAHIQTVSQFYADNYPQTIFSKWMLEKPFIGLFIDGKLVSAAGTIVIDQKDHAANIGNFLTAPQHRGKRYSQLLAKALINELMNQGIKTFSLGTTVDNVPACRAYEAVGFRPLEKRVELEMRALDRCAETG